MTIRDVHVFLQSFETLKYELSRSKLNYLDLVNVPACYMHQCVRELLEQANQQLDKAFYYHALMNKICQATQWNQEGVLETIETDPFSKDAKMCVEGFVGIRASLQDVVAHLRTLPSSPRKPGFETIAPMEIFDVEQWKLILNALYIMDARSEVIGAVRPIMKDIIECATCLVTIIANLKVDREKIVFNGPGCCSTPELYPEITVAFEKEQVYFSEEEIERLKQEEAERAEQEAKRQRQLQLEKEVGVFRKELWDLLHQSNLWDEKERGYIKLLFPEAADRSYIGLGMTITEDAGLFLNTFKKLICGHTDQPTNLTGQLSSFFHAFSAHEGGAGYSISRDWMSDKELNSLVKFFLNAGLIVTAMQTMTELDGTLALTALHSKEVILVTT